VGVSVTESFDAFLARLSSQAASRDAMTRGMAIEPYGGLKVTDRELYRTSTSSRCVRSIRPVLTYGMGCITGRHT